MALADKDKNIIEKAFHHIANSKKDILIAIKEGLELVETELRAEFQKKISEIQIERDSEVCSNCEHMSNCVWLSLGFNKARADTFSCGDFKKIEEE